MGDANHRVRRVDPDGVITTVAGTGNSGFIAEGEPVEAVGITGSGGVVVDAKGRVLIADTGNYRIRRIS